MATTLRGVRLQWASSRYILHRHDGIRVRFDAVAPYGMTANFFAYRMKPLDPTTNTSVGFFSHICSPSDIAEYPENEPNAGSEPQWFRLSYVDVWVRSVSEATDFIAAVREDVRRLKTTLDVMDTLIEGGEEVIGDLAPESSSSMSSLSSAQSSESAGA